jgi:hypothetical protein
MKGNAALAHSRLTIQKPDRLSVAEVAEWGFHRPLEWSLWEGEVVELEFRQPPK